jgi:hypothetical protein
MPMKQPRPKARCPICGTVSAYAEHINRRCVKELESDSDEPKRCDGTFRSAVSADDWVACQVCGAMGSHDGASCVRCSGDGWLHRH